MFVLLFALWILFNGKITLEICLFGLVISGAIYLFAIKLLDYDPKKELKALKKLGGIFHFLLVLLRDIIKASFHVIGVILSPKKEVDPKLALFLYRSEYRYRPGGFGKRDYADAWHDYGVL